MTGTERCRVCNHLIGGDYFRRNRMMACPQCAFEVRSGQPGDSHVAFTRGLVLGIAAAIAGMIMLLLGLTSPFLDLQDPAHGLIGFSSYLREILQPSGRGGIARRAKRDPYSHPFCDILQLLKIIAKVRLNLTAEQRRALLRTLVIANTCANWLSEEAWNLAATCNIDNPTPQVVAEFLGVDMGVVQIASDSDGDQFSGSMTSNVRYRHRKLRKSLQAAQSKSAKRRLKKLAGSGRPGIVFALNLEEHAQAGRGTWAARVWHRRSRGGRASPLDGI